jgi:type II secretory pathway pseudopilin PulG
VLIGVLVFIVIIAVLLSGIGKFVASSSMRASTDADYAAALNLAYAGVNYELQKISTNPSSADQKWTSSGTLATTTPYTIPIPGQSGTNLPGQFTVTVCASSTTDPNGVNPSTPWTSPQTALIQATGTVHPGTSYAVSRTVQVTSNRSGIFQNNSSFIVGSVSTSTGSQVIMSGDVGSNVTVPSSYNACIYGHMCFHGCNGATCPNATCTKGITYQPNCQHIPTTSDCADSCVKYKTGSCNTGAGLNWICNNNDNSNIKCLSYQDDNNITNPPTDIRTTCGCDHTTCDTDWIFPNCHTDNNSGDKIGGNRHCYPAATYSFTSPNKSCSQAAQGCYHTQCMILEGAPAGKDYYFEHINCGSGQSILIDNAKGPVRIWIGNCSGSWNSWQDDYIGCPVHFTSTDPTKCRIYYCKPQNTLHLCTEMNLCASVHCYCGTDQWGNCQGTLECSHNCYVQGSLVCGNLNCTGNTTCNLPANNVDTCDQAVNYYCTSTCADTCPSH